MFAVVVGGLPRMIGDIQHPANTRTHKTRKSTVAALFDIVRVATNGCREIEYFYIRCKTTARQYFMTMQIIYLPHFLCTDTFNKGDHWALNAAELYCVGNDAVLPALSRNGWEHLSICDPAAAPSPIGSITGDWFYCDARCTHKYI